MAGGGKEMVESLKTAVEGNLSLEVTRHLSRTCKGLDRHSRYIERALGRLGSSWSCLRNRVEPTAGESE